MSFTCGTPKRRTWSIRRIGFISLQEQLPNTETQQTKFGERSIKFKDYTQCTMQNQGGKICLLQDQVKFCAVNHSNDDNNSNNDNARVQKF